MTVELAIQQLINALSLGSLYSLMALGLAIVFSILGLLNFAYGEILAVTSYIMFLLIEREVPFVIAAVPGVAAAIVTSLVIERVAFRPLRGASFLTILFSSFAMAIILQNLLRQVISKRPRVVPIPQLLDSVFRIGTFQFGVLPVLTFVIAIMALIILVLFLQKTNWGLTMRAAAEDFEVARLMGVRANRVIALAFAVSGFIGGIAGVLWLARRGAVNPTMGFIPVLKAFIAVVIGGLGSLKGAIYGGFVLAFMEVSLMVLLPIRVQPFTDAFALIGVVIILYFKPGGLITPGVEMR